MFKYLFRRIIICFVVLFLVMTLLYFTTWMAMIDQYGPGLHGFDFMGIIYDRYIQYLKNIILFWDWGVAESGDSVWPLVMERVHYTLKITLASLVFFVVFGIGLGLACAIKKGSIFDKVVSYLTTAFSSLPSFILVWFFMLFLGWKLDLLPATYPVGTDNPITAILGLVIPVLSLSLWPLSKFIQLIRGEIIENIDAEYMLLARTKGLTRTQGILRHLTKNTMTVILPEITNSFMFVITGSFLVEIIYNVQGVANLFYDAMIKPMYEFNIILIDIPTTVLIATFYVSFGLIISLINDVIYTFIDPRIKIGSKKYHQTN